MGISEVPGEQRDYASYLLRMWQDGGDEESPQPKEAAWRATLQSPHTGALVGFASLDALFGFLRRQAGLEPAADKGQGDR